MEAELDKNDIKLPSTISDVEFGYQGEPQKPAADIGNSSSFLGDSTDEWDDFNIKKNFITWQGLIVYDLPPIEWVVQGLIPKSGITILGGDSGSYKTFVAMHIACCIAEGLPVFGHFQTTKGKVIYIDEENGKIVIKSRLLKIVPDGSYNIDNVAYVSDKNIKLDDVNWKKRLEDLIMEFKPDLIIIDSMVRFFSGSENSSDDVKKIFDMIKYFKAKYNAAWLILHHTRKGHGKKGKDDLRGSGDFAAFVDAVSIINKENNQITITQSKNRHQIPIPDFGVEVINKEDKTLVFEYRKLEHKTISSKPEQCVEAIKEWILEFGNKEFKTAEIKELLKDKHTQNSIFSALEILMKKSIIKKGARGSYKVNIEWFDKESKII